MNPPAGLWHQQALFARDVSKLIEYIFMRGYYCTLGETYRTPEQALIYQKQGIGIKNSLHCKRLAIDINLFDVTGKYLTRTNDHKEFGAFWERLNSLNRWGGNFAKPDGNHYERREQSSYAKASQPSPTGYGGQAEDA